MVDPCLHVADEEEVMVESTERRIARALMTTNLTQDEVAREWNVCRRTVERIAQKYGIKKQPCWYKREKVSA